MLGQIVTLRPTFGALCLANDLAARTLGYKKHPQLLQLFSPTKFLPLIVSDAAIGYFLVAL